MNATTKPQRALANYASDLVYEQWYVAGYREDFTETQREIILLERSLVIFRTSDGRPVALQNRCAHRGFPLSKSFKEGDGIRCRYHGALFNADGEMVEVPAQEKCPKVTLRSYPLREVGPFVWIWMGAADGPDDDTLPALPFLEDGWEFATGKFDVESNYLLMMENLMDLTHIPFLHQQTFKYPKSYAKVPMTVETDGNEMRYTRENLGDVYHQSVFFPKTVADGIEGRDYTASSVSYFKSPAWMYAAVELELLDPPESLDPDLQKTYSFRVAHFLTPATQTTSHYWWCLSRNYALEDAAHTQKLEETLTVGFEEDMECCRELQRLHTTDGHDYTEMNFISDKSTLTMRRIVAGLIAAEA